MRAVANYLSQMLAIAEAEVRKLRHDPVDLFTRIVQPALWLLIFGQVFARLRDIPTGGVSYRDFLPLFFASSAIYSIKMMPTWLQHVALVSPLTYQVDALRTLMLPGFQSGFGLVSDFAIQSGVFLALILIAGRLYQTILE